jgi:hypothetical protein
MLLILIFIILAVVEGGIFIEDVYFTIYNTNLNTRISMEKTIIFILLLIAFCSGATIISNLSTEPYSPS